MGFFDFLISQNKDLKKNLRIAKIKDTPKEYVKKSFMLGLMMGIGFFVFSFVILNKTKDSYILPVLVGLIICVLFYKANLRKVHIAIKKKAKKIDKSVLFAGRFLLIKLNSGDPLINAIEEAAKSYGLASEYFGEIIRDVELGTSLEGALEKATEYCPSKHLKKILFQITNALEIGIDVTEFLEATMDEIADEQLMEIMKYGKKLSSLTMFYMLLAVIVPSLGMTLFVVVASLISININMLIFGVIITALVFIQFIFITFFKSARPNMEV